ERDGGLEVLQFTEDERPAGPRARQRNVEVIASRLGREAGRAVARHRVAKERLRTAELAARRLRVIPVRSPLAVDEESHAHALLIAFPPWFARGEQGAAPSSPLLKSP